MLKSNSKKAIDNVKAYIMNNFDGTNYGIEKPQTFKETAEIIMHCFYEEVGKHDKRILSWQNKFTEWLKGLPSIIDSCYYYNRSAVSDVGMILEESESEMNQYTEEKAEELLSWLIFREIYKACRYIVK